MELQLDDIQGIIRRGYGELEFSYFVMLKIEDARRTKEWLGALDIRDGTTKPTKSESCINVAFTHPGFEALRLTALLVGENKFSIEFEDGMTTDHRMNILGDHGNSHPDKWDWGGERTEPVHIILLLYAGSEEARDELYQVEKAKFIAGGLQEVRRLSGIKLPDRKEHFGFRDGISQPQIAGLLDKTNDEDEKGRSQQVFVNGGSDGNIVAAGEFILGYRNVYSKTPASPMVGEASDPGDYLCPAQDRDELRDFGRNGSYLVFRQLSQDVKKFWQYLDGVAGTSSERDRLGAKMVGRWRGGAPLVMSPNADDPALKDAQDFGYYHEDYYGDRCPAASHTRRTNPRDSKDSDNKTPDVALSDANKHRIIRRGRPYGQPLARSMDPEDILNSETSSDGVGLLFLCFNANIGRQFEFIQHTWVNSPKFDGLYSSADPLLGDANPKSVERGIFGNFVVPQDPLRSRRCGLTRFVEVTGGAYFFMPGIKAIKYLAHLREPKGASFNTADSRGASPSIQRLRGHSGS